MKKGSASRFSVLATALFLLCFCFLPAASGENLKIDRILGKAEMQVLLGNEKREAVQLREFAKGDRLSVPGTGGLDLKNSSGTVRVFLEGGADIENAGISQNGRIKYILHRGTVWLRIMERMNLEIKTPLAVVSIRGTEFGVTAGPSFTYVHVIRGEVSVTDNSGRETLLEAGDSINVSEYETLLKEMLGEEPLAVIPLPFHKLTEGTSGNGGNDGRKGPASHGGGTPPGGGGETPPF